jgi:two-component system response regulator AtoC
MKILVIDDEQLIRWSLEKHFSNNDYTVFTAETGEEGLEIFKSQNPDITFLDNQLPGIQGLDVIGKIISMDEDAVIVFMTAYGSIETAVNAMKFGASDFISKPFTLKEIDLVFNEASKKIKIKRELQIFRRQQTDTLSFDHIIGESESLDQIKNISKKIASTETTTILLLGESGTGKDLFARAIHNESARKDRPFVTINCSTLPDTLLESELFGHEKGAFTDAKKLKKGFFEVANGGTVFLDEIGEINHATQLKLLGVLENRVIRRIGGTSDIKVDVRIIAATNKDIETAVANKTFREDLYYRLKVFQIVIPPLRNRKEDIPALAAHFIKSFNQQFGKKIEDIYPDAIDLMTQYDWPGNVRELRNVLERAVILETGDGLGVESLPMEINRLTKESYGGKPESEQISGSEKELPERAKSGSLYDMEKQMLIRALKEANSNQSKAARILGISRDTLRYRMKKYEL